MSGDPGWVKQDAGTVEDAPRAASTTDGTLLGGRVAYRQYRGAYRTGLEPVLMAAAVPARPGQRVLEAGCGAGAGLLCLAARVPGLWGMGVEQDAAMAALARSNFEKNGLDWPLICAPLGEADPHDHSALHGPFDHAFANPPWHRANATRSPDRQRDLARRAPAGMLADWVGALSRRLRSRGTLTLALPAALHAEAAAAMIAARFGTLCVLPFWPKAGRASRIILMHGVLHGRGDGRVLPGLVLHDARGFTPEADAVLRDAAALPWR